MSNFITSFLSKLVCNCGIPLEIFRLLGTPLIILSSWNEFFLAGGSNGQSGPAYSGRAAFGFVEKAEVKLLQTSRRVSMGSSGDDGMVDFSLCDDLCGFLFSHR